MEEFTFGFLTCVVMIVMFLAGGPIYKHNAYRYAYDCLTAAQDIDVCKERLEERMGM